MNALLYRNNRRGLLCLLLAAILLLAACGRGPDAVESTAAPEETTAAPLPAGIITAPYTELDSLNPFYTKTLLNASLISLVYESLFYLDVGFMPQPMIASGSSLSEATLRVTLENALVFSDASPLTAADVVYSFTLAKEAPLYRTALKGISACEAEGVYTVAFTLEQPDVNVLNVLTFPIVKEGTADDAEARPVGSGCYLYRQDETRSYLEYNLRHAGGIPEIGKVRLRGVNESSTLMHQLNTGSIDCFYTDMSDGIAKRSYSGATEIYLNNLVFLGVNHYSPLLGYADLRKAISLALSRQALAENAFVSHARAAVYPVNSSWDALAGLPEPQNAAFESNPNAADAILAKMNLGSDGEPLYYNLIVEDGNAFMQQAAALVRDQLALVNLNLTVNTLSHKEFAEALESGAYDFYLSEIKLTKNMDLTPFFSAGGAAAYGTDRETTEVDEIYAHYRSGETDLSRFLESFDAAMPFIPLVFRNGQFCYSRSVKSGVVATEERPFLNVAEWKV